MRAPTLWEQLQAGPVVYYDELPDDDELRQLKAQRRITITQDRDRVGWSKTGVVYRVEKNDAA